MSAKERFQRVHMILMGSQLITREGNSIGMYSRAIRNASADAQSTGTMYNMSHITFDTTSAALNQPYMTHHQSIQTHTNIKPSSTHASITPISPSKTHASLSASTPSVVPNIFNVFTKCTKASSFHVAGLRLSLSLVV